MCADPVTGLLDRLDGLLLPALVCALAGVGLPVHADPVDGAGTGWSVDVGGGFRTHPVHLGSSRYTVDGQPLLNVQIGRDFSASLDDGVKWTAIRAGPFALGPVAEYRQSYGDRASRGAVSRTDALEFGGFTTLDLGVGVLEARLRKAVTGYGGWSGDLAFDTGMKLTPTVAIGGEIRSAWANSAFSHDYFSFGKPASGDRDALAFEENDYYSAGFEFDADKTLTPRIHIALSASFDRMFGPMWHSDLLQTRNVAVVGLGLYYRFGSP
jgi:outer membrane scaffolding protein for murein synthesis (MipA/OmpV family)